MTAAADGPRGADGRPDYRDLPPGVPLDDTVATVDPAPPPDDASVRHLEQHRALRDD